jgi:hypothetical protein
VTGAVAGKTSVTGEDNSTMLRLLPRVQILAVGLFVSIWSVDNVFLKRDRQISFK